MSAVILRDEIYHYEVLGRGRPIVFLHGWVGSWRYWIPVMQAASVSFRAYAVDCFGFGDSGKNTAYYSVEEQVASLQEFLEQLGMGKIALVGHGLGAVMALLYASQRPGLVDRLMAIGLPFDLLAVNPRLRASSPAELADWLLGRSPSTEAAYSDAPRADPQAIAVSLQNLPALNAPELLARLAAPTLLVHGQNDPAVTPPSAERLAELPEQAHAIAFESSGHFPMLDEPSKFNRLLNDFLSLASGETPRHLQLKEEWKRRVR
ncbi:MAG: alpha/beta hydrolase [Chloroflexi bacterium]|nr:alpha/beta hydrolase [Chloroflexota bacterium]